MQFLRAYNKGLIMERVSLKDSSWQSILDEWSKQCHEFGEDFESFLPATLPMLERQIADCETDPNTGVFSSFDEQGEHQAICFLNGAHIPKFSGRVLRVRHLILAPKYDFGDYTADVYASLLSKVFEGVLQVSDSEIPCENIKFHFRSPADVALYREFAADLNDQSRFSSVKMKGAWLFVNKE